MRWVFMDFDRVLYFTVPKHSAIPSAILISPLSHSSPGVEADILCFWPQACILHHGAVGLHSPITVSWFSKTPESFTSLQADPFYDFLFKLAREV
jgi:hypothetical protein